MPLGIHIVPAGIKVQSASVQNVLACKYITPMSIKVISVSAQNILACKYLAPTGIEIVSVVVQIVPTGENLPYRLQI